MTSNLPAAPGFKPAPTPTYDRHKSELLPFTYQSTSGSSHTVWPSKIIALADCHAILREIEASSTPATAKMSARLASMLIAAYPERTVVDADTYLEFLSRSFAEYPVEVGIQAIDRLTRKVKFLPSRAELIEQLEAITSERRSAAARARQLIDDHRKRNG